MEFDGEFSATKEHQYDQHPQFVMRGRVRTCQNRNYFPHPNAVFRYLDRFLCQVVKTNQPQNKRKHARSKNHSPPILDGIVYRKNIATERRRPWARLTTPAPTFRFKLHVH